MAPNSENVNKHSSESYADSGNNNCVKGAENRTRIIALEDNTKEIKETLKAIEGKLDKVTNAIHEKINNTVLGMKDKMIELAGKPGWLVLLIISVLTSISTGLIVYLTTNK